MLVVGLFDGFASWAAFGVAGVPHAALWAVITGSLALVPFLGYVAVTALALKLAITGAAMPALLSFGLGYSILFCGDKIVRPAIARGATRLRFVWILMGCLGGFEVLGLVGLVVGPVLLTITRELWEQRVRDLAPPDGTDPTSPVDDSA
jgi:predicted PurR-regulated permease PerM